MSLILPDEHVVFTFDNGWEVLWHGLALTLSSGAVRDVRLAVCECADRHNTSSRGKEDGDTPDPQAPEGDAAQGDVEGDAPHA